MGNAPRFLGGHSFSVCSAVSYFSTRVGSIIGAGWLSFRVRDGSGRFPAAMAAVTLFFWCPLLLVGVFWWWGGCLWLWCGCEASLFTVSKYKVGFVLVVVSFRPVSASSLRPLLGF